MTSNPQQPKVPKDLGIKIGSKIEARWTAIMDKAKEEIVQLETQIIINETIIQKAEEIIKREKETFK